MDRVRLWVPHSEVEQEYQKFKGKFWIGALDPSHPPHNSCQVIEETKGTTHDPTSRRPGFVNKLLYQG